MRIREYRWPAQVAGHRYLVVHRLSQAFSADDRLLGIVAGNPVIGLNLAQLRLDFGAIGARDRAAWVESAARRRVGRTRDVTFKDDPVTTLTGDRQRDGRDERLSVWVLRML